MSNRFHDLSFERLDGGAIQLTQRDFGEECVITAHSEQILFIARRLCGLKAETADKVADLERRISVLTDGFQKLVDAEWFRKDIVEHCHDGIEILCRLDALLDLALEFDGGRLQPNGIGNGEAQEPPQKLGVSSKLSRPGEGEQLGLDYP